MKRLFRTSIAVWATAIPLAGAVLAQAIGFDGTYVGFCTCDLVWQKRR